MAHIDQNVIGLRLTVKASARCSKRRVPPGLTAILKELNDVVRGSRLYDNLRNEPIRAPIGGIPYQIDCPVKDVLVSQQGDEVGLQVAGRSIDQRGGHCIVRWGSFETPAARRRPPKQL